MTLYALKREYEERRQSLVDKLKNNPGMDPAIQHQLYGAIKEIENFLQAIDFQIENEQKNSLNLDLQRDRPKPLVERTKKFAGKVKKGTRSVIREKIPKVTAKVTSGPRKALAKRRAKKALKKQIEQEIRARMRGGLPSHIHEEIPPELPSSKEPELGMSGTVTDVNVSEQPNMNPAVRVEQQKTDRGEEGPKTAPAKKSARRRPAKAKRTVRRKPTRKKATRKSSRKKTARKKPSKRKPARRTVRRKPTRKKTTRKRRK